MFVSKYIFKLLLENMLFYLCVTVTLFIATKCVILLPQGEQPKYHAVHEHNRNGQELCKTGRILHAKVKQKYIYHRCILHNHYLIKFTTLQYSMLSGRLIVTT